MLWIVLLLSCGRNWCIPLYVFNLFFLHRDVRGGGLFGGLEPKRWCRCSSRAPRRCRGCSRGLGCLRVQRGTRSWLRVCPLGSEGISGHLFVESLPFGWADPVEMGGVAFE